MNVLTLSGPQPLWTVQKVAERFDVSDKWIYEMCATGAMPHIRLGSNIRFHYVELVAWFNDQRDRGTWRPPEP